MKIEMEPIAVVIDSRQDVEDDFWGGASAGIRLADALPGDALVGLEEFSHVEILFYFHLVETSRIIAGARHPRNNHEWPSVGIFAQRAKNRPNRIGSTICRVSGVHGRTLLVRELDAVTGTPVLDIKPVMAEFLPREPVHQPCWSTDLMKNYWAPK